MSAYQKEYQVRYYDVDRFGEAGPVTMLNYLEDTAICHSESVGLGVDRLLAQNNGWVLNRWHLVMDRYPKLWETVCITTWASSFERFYATREFIITDQAGQEYGRAGSLWIFFNLEKRRPVRIPQEISEAYQIHKRTVMEQPFVDFVPQSAVLSRPQGAKRFQVRRSDIDTNGHVNNTRYVEWMLEGIDDETAQEYRLACLEVLYKKEINYGTEIESLIHSLEFHEEKDQRRLYHQIVNCTSGVEHALGRTTWRKR